jgi:hypothetical protein
MPAVDTNPHASTEVNATRARQGRRGRHVLIVLLASTALAAIVLFTVFGLRSGDMNAADRSQQPAASETGVRPADQVAPKTPQSPNG